MKSGRVDRRREVGMRTRTRLLDAALDQLAERGEDGVNLRELTDAAGANVAALMPFAMPQWAASETLERPASGRRMRR